MRGRYFGVDACAGGWALVELSDGRPVMHLFVAEFAGVLERTRHAYLVLVDTPIGLADPTRRGRRCDMLDALALAVNAWLGSEHGLRVLPDEGEELDRYGLRMEMVTASLDSAIPGGVVATTRGVVAPVGHRE